MKTSHLTRTPGIYQIRNLVNGRIYIGSAVDVQKRLHNHQHELRANSHRNPKLQNAWDKYGAEGFEVILLEPVSDVEQLTEREQYWLDVTQACKTGYNCAPRAGSQLGFRHSDDQKAKRSRATAKPIAGFITPDGNPVTILNLGQFCKQQGLTNALMRMVASGKATSHKGWKHVNAKPLTRGWIRTYEGFVDPQGGEIEPITNLEQFCRERGLIASNMNKVYRGAKPSHRGWTHKTSQSKLHEPKRWSVHRGFVNPQGEPVVIENLRKFCRENGLDYNSMQAVKAGKERQHKGWTFQLQK